MKLKFLFTLIGLFFFTSSFAYNNYEETSACVNGIVVYEGNRDTYIIETARGYTIAEHYGGEYLTVGDKVRGPLNTYNFRYIIQPKNDKETKVYIEDYMMSKSSAIEWMEEHDRLK